MEPCNYCQWSATELFKMTAIERTTLVRHDTRGRQVNQAFHASFRYFTLRRKFQLINRQCESGLLNEVSDLQQPPSQNCGFLQEGRWFLFCSYFANIVNRSEKDGLKHYAEEVLFNYVRVIDSTSCVYHGLSVRILIYYWLCLVSRCRSVVSEVPFRCRSRRAV